MTSQCQIPVHITVLYVFAVINLIVLFHASLVDADVIVLKNKNDTEPVEEYYDLPADFGPELSEVGLVGRLVYVNPRNACIPISPPPNISTTDFWIALIARNDCDFGLKVFHAQEQGYSLAIVHNYQGDDYLTTMAGGQYGNKVTIPSVFIGYSDGQELADRFSYQQGFLIRVNDKVHQFEILLWPFAVVVGICFILMVMFMGVKWFRDVRKKKKSRLSKKHLKKIPVKKFKKGDTYETCAICLDDYEEGEKLRILPCHHAYHMKCIDPWLLKNKRTCPVCKRKVIPGNDTESDSESEDEEAGSSQTRSTERTPLLAGQASAASTSGALGQTPRTLAFERSGLPEGVRGDVTLATEMADEESTSDSSEDGQSTTENDSQPKQATINSGYSTDSSDEPEIIVAQPNHEPTDNRTSANRIV